MTTAGPNAPGTMTTLFTGGYSWTNPNNAKVSDNTYTTTGNQSQFFGSALLIFSNFGFAIPAGATINGIEFNLERKASVGSALKDSVIQITTNANSGTGTNKAVTTPWPTSDAVATYGGSSDLWGLTPTVSDVNSNNFGVVVSTIGTSVTNVTPSIDFGSLTIYYTPSGGGGPAATTRRLGLLGVG